MIRYTIFGDTNGLPSGDAFIISDFVNTKALSANVAKSDTIPTGAKFVLITATATTFFRIWGGGTLAVPTDVADGSAGELVPNAIPTMRAIVPAATLGSIANTSTSLTVAATDGITINDTLVIKGAGAAGADLTTTVTAVNPTTGVVTLAAAAGTTVTNAAVTETLNTISVISPATATVVLAYFK